MTDGPGPTTLPQASGGSARSVRAAAKVAGPHSSANELPPAGLSRVCLAAGPVLAVGAWVFWPAEYSWARLLTSLAGMVVTYLGASWSLRRRLGFDFDLAAWMSAVWLVVLVVVAAAADLLPLSEALDPSETLAVQALQRPDMFSAHPLGTDRFGLDMLGQIVYGARVSLLVATGAVLLGGTIGGVLGLLAGFSRGWFDGVVGLFTDTLLSFPPLILLLALVTVLQPSVRNVTIGLAVLAIPAYVRLSRANTLKLAEAEYVMAARALGATRRRIMFREIVPNLLPTLVSYSFLIMAVLIIAEAALSFLGLSVRRPSPTWGNMIAAAQTDFQRTPHLMLPAVPLFLTVFAVNRIGDVLQRKWEGPA